MKKWATIPSDGSSLKVREAVFSFVRIERSLTLKSAITGRKVKQVYKESPNEIISIVVAIIDRYAKQMNTFKTPTEDQLLTMACDIIEQFEYESVEDIILLFKYARQGKFGFRSRFDISVVSEWIPIYMDLKALEREKYIADREGRAAKERENNDRDIAPEVQEKFASIRKELQLKRQGVKSKIPTNSPLNNSQNYLSQLKLNASKLTNSELNKFMKTAKSRNSEVYNILKTEYNNRKKQ